MKTGHRGLDLSQEMLKASCAPDADVARRAWQAICTALDSPARFFTALNNHPSARLFPLLHRRISDLGIDDVIGDFLTGAVAESWGFNLRLFERAMPVIDSLTERGIELATIKGFALIGDSYPTHELRPMGDLDIVIRTRDMKMSREVLEDLGWRLSTPVWPSESLQNWAYIHGSHSYPFSVLGSFVIDLHWRGARELTVSSDEMWNHTVPLPDAHPHADKSIRRPDDEWMVIILSMHASQARNGNLVHPFADIARFLGITGSTAGRSVDWERVAHIANRNVVSTRVDNVLAHLYSTLEIDDGEPPTVRHGVSRRRRTREMRAMAADVRQNVDHSGTRVGRLIVQLVQGTRAETPGLGPLSKSRVLLARTLIAVENAVLLRRRRHLDR